MSGKRLDVTVTYNAERGYVASAPELRQPVTALSLGDLRRRIEIAMLPERPRRAAARWSCRARAPPPPGAGATGRAGPVYS
jgi:hypothetical protein